jgi:hemerythrin
MDLTILDRIFADSKGVIYQEYFDASDMILEAIRNMGSEYESEYWERVGFAFLKTHKKEWGYHFIRYSQALDSHWNRKASGSKSTKKLKQFLPPSKFKQLLSGWV